jgi:hypothetical protein
MFSQASRLLALAFFFGLYAQNQVLAAPRVLDGGNDVDVIGARSFRFAFDLTVLIKLTLVW